MCTLAVQLVQIVRVGQIHNGRLFFYFLFSHFPISCIFHPPRAKKTLPSHPHPRQDGTSSKSEDEGFIGDLTINQVTTKSRK